MDKTYEPRAIENRWCKEWESSGAYAPSGTGEPYSIMIPPPNVTGTLHMGHAFQHTVMDALIRHARMSGKDTLWQPGTDHAGIATQMVVERNLKIAGEPSRAELGREKFLEKVWEWKKFSAGTIGQQIRRMGSSVDWSREAFTMDPGYSKAVVEHFVKLHEDGLIYRGKRLVNWDPVLQTAISDLEVVSEEENGKLWHIRYPFSHDVNMLHPNVGKTLDGKDYLVVATTRPETMLGDTAVAIHPDDERYKHLIDCLIELPLAGRKIPVIADKYVDKDFGTGCVKITPAHDFNDNAMGHRHGLDFVNIFTKEAKINDEMPSGYRGLDRFAARKKIVADLEALGLIEKIEDHKLKIPRGDRSGAVLEPYLTDQWFVDLTKKDGGWAKITQPAIDAVESGRIKFVPDNWKTTYFHWLNNIQDWCISRQLWWGHRIPAWYDGDGCVHVGRSIDEARKKLQIEIDELGALTALLRTNVILSLKDQKRLLWVAEKRILNASWPPAWSEEESETFENFVKGDEQSFEVAGKAPSDWSSNERNNFASVLQARRDELSSRGLSDRDQDNDVFDTWFSSDIWPMATQGWPEPTADLKKFYPSNVLVTGFDIIFFWVARMVMMGQYFMRDVPFREVYITGLVRDPEGNKMSKSKGNVLDPLDVVDGISLDELIKKRTTGLMKPETAPKIENKTRKDYPKGIAPVGVDALRFTFAALATNGRDIRFDAGRAEGYRNFCNKIWNASRFVLMNLGALDADGKTLAAPSLEGEVELSAADRWIISRLQKLETEAAKHFAEYRFDLLAQALYQFIWNEYCDWYLELTKPALANGNDAQKRGTRRTLVRVLEVWLRLLHPLMPFITEEIWQKVGPLAGKAPGQLMSQPYPIAVPERIDDSAEADIEWLKAFILGVRQIRGEMDISPAKTLPLLLKNASASDRARVTAMQDSIVFLAKVETPKFLEAADLEPACAAALMGEMKLLVPMAGLIDKDAELARLAKQIEKLKRDLAGVETRLANPNFGKAPEAVQNQTREMAAKLKQDLVALDSQSERIKAL